MTLKRSFALVLLPLIGMACASGKWGDPLSSFRDCAACPEMVVVPAGAFTMGAPDSEPGRFEDEGPQHKVTIAAPFAVSAAPITRGQYEMFVRATNRPASGSCAVMGAEGWARTPGRGWDNPGFEQTAEHPVVCVSWDDAQAYLQWLSKESGRSYRLLSEAEFEYVARAGSTTTFPWGSGEEFCAHANGFDASTKSVYPDWPAATCSDGFVHTSPVRAFPANAFLLYGTVGNVFQWTEDCFVEGGYAGAPADGSARVGEECPLRTIRGGSWLNGPRGLRAAMRDRDRPIDRYTNVGLRVARDR